MQMDDRDRFSDQANSADIGARSRGASADFSADKYRICLDGLELDEDQADELLRIVWDMMRMCVEMNVPAESWGQIVDAVIDGSADESVDVN